MKKIEVNVTQYDIRYGKPCSGTECPIARALKRKRVRVHVGTFELQSLDDNRALSTHPAEVTKFIQTFDTGGAVEPTRFTLEVPE